MKIISDDAWRRFLEAPLSSGWTGVRIKTVRDRTLLAGGRAQLTLFERVDDDRPHPRLSVSMPAVADPAPPPRLFTLIGGPPDSPDSLRTLLGRALLAARPLFDTSNLPVPAERRGSERYYHNNIRAQRISRFFHEVRLEMETWVRAGRLPGGDVAPFNRVLHELEAEAFSGEQALDDSSLGTYFSFEHDEPFVHYLEMILSELPMEHSQGFACLPAEQQESIRRQRAQAQAHLDDLMRRKYAYRGIRETDIERSLGGFLIDRETRLIVSETPASLGTLVPQYELIRIAPESTHPLAGAWVYRDAGGLRLQDGTPVEVDASALRSRPVGLEALSFRRAPGDPRLRAGVRFDWDRSGYVRDGLIDWVSWAGHCDVQAVIEQLGIVLSDTLPLTEYRAETGQTRVYHRALQREMLASVLELGSRYRRFDGTGSVQLGVRHFGGARNDSRPDRLIFQGLSASSTFVWPKSDREESFRITGVELDGRSQDVDRIFFQYLPTADLEDFSPNTRFIKTTDGDDNMINISTARITAEVAIDVFDEETGYPTRQRQEVVIDLRPEATDQRSFLGTWLVNPASRELYRMYLERTPVGAAIVGELEAYVQSGGRWRARPMPARNLRVALRNPLQCRAVREMSLDNPGAFHPLLEEAMRQGRNIIVDSDMRAPVWNGIVLNLRLEKVGGDSSSGIERWHVALKARFGRAELEYLVRRDPGGVPDAWCPLVIPGGKGSPDFFWQDFPDIGSKARVGLDWVVNENMVNRGIVSLARDPDLPGGYYVYDDHIKNVYEMLFCAAEGFSWTILHANKRYGFTNEADWKKTVDLLEKMREELKFDPGG